MGMWSFPPAWRLDLEGGSGKQKYFIAAILYLKDGGCSESNASQTKMDFDDLSALGALGSR